MDSEYGVELGSAATSEEAEPRSLDVRMMVVIATLIGTIIASVLSIAFDADRIRLLHQVSVDAATHNVARFAIDQSNAHANDDLTRVAAIAEAATILVAALAFIVWFYCAYVNLPRLGAKYTRYRVGWAIGSWFVPVLSLFQPKRIADDLWRGSDPESAHSEPDWTLPVSPLLHWWWAMFLLSGVGGQIALRLWDRAESLSSLRQVTVVDIVSSAISIIAAVLAVLVVYELTDRQRRRAYVRATTEPPAAAAYTRESQPDHAGMVASLADAEGDGAGGGEQDVETAWFWWSLLPLGLGAWVPLSAGVRAKRTIWSVLGAAWCLTAIGGFALAIASPSHSAASGIGGLLLILAWISAPLTSLAIRNRYVQILRTLPPA